MTRIFNGSCQGEGGKGGSTCGATRTQPHQSTCIHRSYCIVSVRDHYITDFEEFDTVLVGYAFVVRQGLKGKVV